MVSPRGIRAGAAYVELYAKDNKLVRGLRRASRRLKAFGAGIRGIGVRMAGISAAIIAPLVASTKVFAGMGDELAKMSARTGFTVEALSELGFAAEQGGADIETLEKGIRTMQRSINDAGRELTTAIDALKDLSLTVEDIRDLSPEQQFKLIADRLSAIPDPTKRAAVAMQFLGRAGTRLLPMMRGGAAGMEELQRQARKLGLTISTEAANDAAKFTDEMNILVKVLKRAVFVVGSALVPVLSDASKRIVDVTTRAGKWIKQNKRLVVTIFKFAVAAAAAGGALVVIGASISLLGSILGGLASIITGAGTAIGMLGTVLAALLSPIGLVITAVVSLGAYILVATGAGARALGWLGKKFGELKADALKAYQGIADALAAGDISLAARILWLTLRLQWQKGIHALMSGWMKFKHFFVKVAFGAFYGAQAAWELGVHAMTLAWIEGVAGMKKVWASFTSWHARTVETTANWMAKRWIELQGLFDKTIDVEFATRHIDEQSDARMSQIEDERRDAHRSAERQRKTTRDLARQEHERSMAEIGGKYEGKTKELEEQYDTQMQRSAEALERAREDWRKAVQEAARKRKAQEAEGGPGAMGRPDALKDVLADIGALLAGKKTIGVKGTFNAAAIQGLAAGDAADRTAKATEETAKNTKKLVDKAKQGGLTFA